MTTQTHSQDQDSMWTDENMSNNLRLRVKTFYNADYFDRIILPLLDIPQDGCVLDVGCGYGGLSFLLVHARSDLQVTGVDLETSALESAVRSAKQENLLNVKFEPGDAHQLRFGDDQFDAVVCQTLLTHVRDAEIVVREMARVLKPGGVFMAAEYTSSGAWAGYDNVMEAERDENWHLKYFRLARLYHRGKLVLRRGDEQLGVRVPLLASAAGLDIYDFRLNDRALHVIPPYDHPKQGEYLELLRTLYPSEPDRKELERTITILQAAGATEEEAKWLYDAENPPAVRKAIEGLTLTMMGAYRLYLTFARKP